MLSVCIQMEMCIRDRCSGKSASWKLCGDDRNECFGTAGVYHVSDPDGSRADREGIRWIDGTWDCGKWFASGT